MKKYIVLSLTLLTVSLSNAQENIDDLLAAGINDAKRFTTDYIAPASEGLVYGINNGWFNSGKAPHRFNFSVSLIGNASFIKDDKKIGFVNEIELCKN